MRTQPIQSLECLVLQRNHPAAFLLTLRMRSARFRSKKRKGVSLGPAQHASRSVDSGDGRIHPTDRPHVGSSDRSTATGCADGLGGKLAVATGFAEKLVGYTEGRHFFVVSSAQTYGVVGERLLQKSSTVFRKRNSAVSWGEAAKADSAA